MGRILDTSDASNIIKKRLKNINDNNIIPQDVLSKLDSFILNKYEGKKIETTLGFGSLTIYTEKKKNSAMGILKDNIESLIEEYVHMSDRSLLFDIHKLDSRVIVNIKRIIEQ